MATTSVANQTTPKSSKKITEATAAATKTSTNLATHPPTATMVQNALKTLNERGGSSLAAIKKFIVGTYKVDSEKYAHHIRKYLVTAVDSGKLLRTKGKGAAGSFKLVPEEKPKKKKEEKPKKKEVKPVAAAKKEGKPLATKKDEGEPSKKSVKPVKSAAPKKVPASKLKMKTPVKAKTTKNAIRKVKTPKPKKATPKKVVAAKKKVAA